MLSRRGEVRRYVDANSPVQIVEQIHQDNRRHETEVNLALETSLQLQTLLHAHVAEELRRLKASGRAFDGRHIVKVLLDIFVGLDRGTALGFKLEFGSHAD
jgi:hypothetical protein